MKPHLRNLLVIIATGAALSCASRAFADAININFVGSSNDYVGGSAAGYPSAPDNVAWNNISGSSSGGNALGAGTGTAGGAALFSGTGLGTGSASTHIVDTAGATPLTVVSFDSGQTSTTGLYNPPSVNNTQNGALLQDYLDGQTFAPASVTVQNIPGAITGAHGGYEVAVYVAGVVGGSSSFLSSYTLTPGGIGASGAQTLGVATGPVYSGSNNGLQLATPGGVGNYIVFANVTGTSFTLSGDLTTITNGGNGAAINGLSIFGTAGGGGGGGTPEPGSMILMTLGALGLAGMGIARRRRAPAKA